MRWDNRIKFAILPKWCDCGHTVWLEKYYYLGDREIGCGYSSFPVYSCKECYIKKKLSREK